MTKTLQFNFKFSKKFLAGALLAGITMAGSSKLNAQIAYVDIPDGIPSFIDFNSDGNPEFNINPSGSLISNHNYSPGNNYHVISESSWDFVNFVAAGFTIDSSCRWYAIGEATLDGYGTGNSTRPAPGAEAYIAVRFNLTGMGDDIYYGWIRVAFTKTGLYEYKEFAYNTVPGSAIQAGTKNTLSINEVKLTKLNLYPNPVKENLYFTDMGNTEQKFRTYTIFNLTGQIIIKGEIAGNSINLSSLVPGAYLISFIDEEGNKSETKKLIKG